MGDPIPLGGAPVEDASQTAGYTDTFDAQKRLVSRSDARGNQVAIRYDSNGRVMLIAGPQGLAMAYTRDASGRLAAVRTATGSATYTYAGGEKAARPLKPGTC